MVRLRYFFWYGAVKDEGFVAAFNAFKAKFGTQLVRVA